MWEFPCQDPTPAGIMGGRISILSLEVQSRCASFISSASNIQVHSNEQGRPHGERR